MLLGLKRSNLFFFKNKLTINSPKANKALTLKLHIRETLVGNVLMALVGAPVTNKKHADFWDHTVEDHVWLVACPLGECISEFLNRPQASVTETAVPRSALHSSV